MDSRIDILNLIERLFLKTEINHIEIDRNGGRVFFDGDDIDLLSDIQMLRNSYIPETDSIQGKIENLNNHFMEERIQDLEDEIQKLKDIIHNLINEKNKC